MQVYRLLFTLTFVPPSHHAGTKVTWQRKYVLDTIMTIQPKDSNGGTRETRESIVYKIAQDMLDKLPPD